MFYGNFLWVIKRIESKFLIYLAKLQKRDDDLDCSVL